MNKAQTVKRPHDPDPRPRTRHSRRPSPKDYRRAARDERRQQRLWLVRQRRLALIEHWRWYQEALEQWRSDGCYGNPPSLAWSQTVLTWLAKSR